MGHFFQPILFVFRTCGYFLLLSYFQAITRKCNVETTYEDKQ